jgi:Putative transposase/Transposase zinc-binding domain
VKLELADVVRAHGPAFLAARGQSLSYAQRKVLKAIGVCRTAALGGHVEQCSDCGHRLIAYNSCRDRHCPKCQAAARAEWLQERAAELLPVNYFHVVFTLPAALGPIALQNRAALYSILFRAASETLLTIAADPKHLGATIGFLAVLHTWGQNLQHHPHLHCVIPGGGIGPDRASWIACRKSFFLPVRVLSRLFRSKFLAYLRQAFLNGDLSFHGKLEVLKAMDKFLGLLRQSACTEWVVYAKPPFGSPEQVLKYLARYTHRVAISNQRLLSCADAQVLFRWKDYASGNKQKTMTLDADEFLRRFLLHVLPPGFVKIRHFGFLANRCRKASIALCRGLLDHHAPVPTQPSTSAAVQVSEALPERPASCCPACKTGRLFVIQIVVPDGSGGLAGLTVSSVRANDTS